MPIRYEVPMKLDEADLLSHLP